MADIKITDLAAYTSPASTDVLPIVDVGADATKKVSIADLMENASAGSAAAPSIAFDGDSDTGIYRPTTNELGISTAGTERLRIDSAGNVGIGTSGPVAKFDIRAANDSTVQANVLTVRDSGASSYAAAMGATSDGGAFIARGNASVQGEIQFATTDGSYASYTERMRIDASGRVGIGTSSAGSFSGGNNQLVVGDGSGNRGLTVFSSTTGTGTVAFNDTASTSNRGLIRYDHSVDAMTLYTSAAESMRIDTAGRVGIGISSPDTNSSLDVDGRVQSSQDFVATTRGTNGGVADFILLTSASGGSPLGARIRHDGSNDILSISNDPGTSTQHLLIRGNGVLNYVSCPTYADDSAAGTGGLVAGDIYKTSTGELRIKL